MRNWLKYALAVYFIAQFVAAVSWLFMGLTVQQALSPSIAMALTIGLFFGIFSLLRLTSGDKLYESIKPWIKRMEFKHRKKPITHIDLVYLFEDNDGRSYYEFGESMGLPIARFFKQKEYFEFLAAGVSKQSMSAFHEKINELILTAIENRKNQALFQKDIRKVQALMEQLNYRAENIKPLDLFINTLAVTFVREDENPEKFNQQIHEEKCNFLMEHIEDYSFFFQSMNFQALSNLLNLSRSAFEDNLRRWQREMLKTENQSSQTIS